MRTHWIRAVDALGEEGAQFLAGLVAGQAVQVKFRLDRQRARAAAGGTRLADTPGRRKTEFFAGFEFQGLRAEPCRDSLQHLLLRRGGESARGPAVGPCAGRPAAS